MNNKQYKILIILLTIITSTIIEIQRSQINIFTISGVFTILGGCIGIILGSYLFASLIRYGFKLSLWGINFEDKPFLKIFIVIWCIYVLLNFIGTSS